MWYIGRKKVRRKSAKRRNYVPRAFCLPRHYEVREPGEAHKLGKREQMYRVKTTVLVPNARYSD